jgi:hypothetical protein
MTEGVPHIKVNLHLDKLKFECCGKYFEGIGELLSATLLQFLGNCDTMGC